MILRHTERQPDQCRALVWLPIGLLNRHYSYQVLENQTPIEALR